MLQWITLDLPFPGISSRVELSILNTALPCGFYFIQEVRMILILHHLTLKATKPHLTVIDSPHALVPLLIEYHTPGQHHIKGL